jgi:hypothetical protein
MVMAAAAPVASVPMTPRVALLPAGVSSVGLATDTVPGSNNIVDLVLGPPGVWAATGGGVSRYSLSDGTWETFTRSNGIAGSEIPAVQVIGDQIWVSTSHSRVIQEQPVPWGDGIHRSVDGGASWTKVVRDTVVATDSGQAWGPFMLAYDLAPFRDRVLAACFAGGLVMINPQDRKWENIFPSEFARTDFINKNFQSYNNRFFSCVVDSAVAESLAVIAGSALGINKFVYLDSALKITGFNFPNILLAGSNLYAATERGLSLGANRKGQAGDSLGWRTTYFDGLGFPSNHVGAMAVNGDTILLGIDAVADSSGAGLAISIDAGATWMAVQPPQTIGLQRRAASIISAAGAWWIACEDGGLIRSEDLAVWDSVIITDFLPGDTAAALRHVNALLAVARNDTTMLYAGTDSSIVVCQIPGGGLPDSAAVLSVGALDDKLGNRVTGLAFQQLADSGVIWSFHRPVRTDSTRKGYAVSSDGGKSWIVSKNLVCPNDAAFHGSTFYLALDGGVTRGVVANIDSMPLRPNFKAYRATPAARSIALQIEDDSVAVWVGTDSGLVVTRDEGLKWRIMPSNPNPFQFDLNYHTYYLPIDTTTDQFPSMSGDFVTALGIQNDAGRRIYWAGTQPTGTGQRAGISRSEDGGLNWTAVVPACADTCSGQVNAWNFAFDGFNVWVATSQGLLHSPNVGATWETFRQFADTTSGAVIDSTEVYAVRVVGDRVWIGTANGLAILDKADPSRGVIVRRTFVDPPGELPSGKGGAYASPVPFSPNFHDGVRLHFKPPVDGNVTITIYDFANNVVKSFANVGPLQKDVAYHEKVLWDGRNGKGEDVAVGTYFFVVEYSNGQTQWGKIAVIP